MKRQIKFRIWNGQQMEYNIMAGFLGAFYVQGIDEKDSASMSPFNAKYENAPLMQFIGLKDKQGKEIYEGDIYDIYESKDANTTEAGILKYSNCDVVFNAGCFCFNVPVRPLGRVALPIYFENGREWIYKGTIYENPELL